MAEEKFQIRILDGSLSSMREEPTPLEDALVYFATRYPGQHLSVDQLIEHACSKNANDQLKLSLHGAFNYWDHASGLAWTNGTTPNTKERRRRVYDCLKLSPKQAHDLDSAIPLYVAEHPTVIAESHKLWYNHERAVRGFYWPAYRKYLAEKSKWNEDALLSLDESTRAVIERLSDPSQAEAYQSKGLVVGYVQSGKTANFTGVVARAADAGYRLIIILTGTTEILRRQTQRRLDKEMIGRQFLENDYKNDRELNSFVIHPTLPSFSESSTGSA